HDQKLSVRHQLGDRDRHVAGSRWQVEQQDVQVSPEDVAEELLDRAVQHRATPHDRGVVAHKVADGDQLHAVRLQRHDHFIDLVRPVGAAHHVRDGVTVDIGVDHADLQATALQGDRQVHGSGGLAHTTLAGGHGVDAGRGVRLRERDYRVGGIAADDL